MPLDPDWFDRSTLEASSLMLRLPCTRCERSGWLIGEACPRCVGAGYVIDEIRLKDFERLMERITLSRT